MHQILHHPTPPDFSLSGVVLAHGWYQLAPYRWDADAGVLHRTEALPGADVVHLEIEQRGDTLWVRPDPPPPPAATAEALRRVRWCLRLDEDLSEFMALCGEDPDLMAAALASGGRLLRSPTVWEDAVRTIMTTNTTWRQTVAMTRRLVGVLGPAHGKHPELRAFPAPEAVAANPEALEMRVRLGYRNASVLRLARELAGGAIDLEALKDPTLPTPEVRGRLLELPGVGPYAAATLLMLLGRYDELAIDSELRAHVRAKYLDGASSPTPRELAAPYERWGGWRYLAYWFDPR